MQPSRERSTTTAMAHISTGWTGFSIRYRGPYASDNPCAQAVLVTASYDPSIPVHNPYGTNTWTITAAATSGPTGDLAAVFQYLNRTWTLTDFRHVQFQLTVTLL